MISIARIKLVVAEHYGVKSTFLASRKRRPSAVRPRHVAMYLARTLTPRSWAVIGRCFQRHHTTIVRACCAVEARKETDAQMRAEIGALTQTLIFQHGASAHVLFRAPRRETRARKPAGASPRLAGGGETVSGPFSVEGA